MMTIALYGASAWLLVGAGLLFIRTSPLARKFEYECVWVDIDAAQTWQRVGFRLLLGAGIVLAWPFLLASVLRSRDVAEPRVDDEPTSPSAALVDSFTEFPATPARLLTLDEVRELGGDVGWRERPRLIAELDRRGYRVAGATTDDGVTVPMTVAVADEIGMPISLHRHKGEWRYRTDPESWAHMAGRAGRATVEDGVVTALSLEVMN